MSKPTDSSRQTTLSLFKFLHSTITTLYTRPTLNTATSNTSTTAELSLRLFLAAGNIADQCSTALSSKESTESSQSLSNFEDIAYEFFAQAFTVYEESISDSRAQYQAVCCVASALHQTRSFSRENYDTLITKCALHGSKLLKKPDQCRAVCAASHLWWVTETRGREGEEPKDLYRDGKRVLECLQRALRVADACMDAAVSVELFVEILNQYVYYFDQENEAVSDSSHPHSCVLHNTDRPRQVTTKYINGLIELIHSNASSSGDASNTAAMEQPKKHFRRTLDYIASREYEGVVTEAKS